MYQLKERTAEIGVWVITGVGGVDSRVWVWLRRTMGGGGGGQMGRVIVG